METNTYQQAPEDHYAGPEEIELVRAFANSIDVEDVRDELAKPDDLEDASLLRAWLLERGLIKRHDRVTTDDLHNALELRGAIRDLAYANHGEPVPPGSFEALERAAARAKLTPRFRAGEPPRLVPQAPGADGALGRIVADAFASMNTGKWQRLKICRSNTCAVVFYDHSKNQSRAWCSMRICGNRTKVRAFRARERSESA